MNVKDYDEVKEIYEEIHHVSTGYTSSVIFLAQQLEQALGRDNLDKYRMNNASSIIKDFNITASQSSISDIYFKDQTAYDYLSEKCFEIFSLSQTGFMYSPDEYGAKMRELLWDGIATIDAYKGVFNLQGNIHDLQILLEAGLGFRRSEGFGLIDLI